MKNYTKIYKDYFKTFRKNMKGDLSESTYSKRIDKILNELAEEDRHILIYYNLGMNVDQISKSIEIDSKRTRKKLNNALKHLITPNNVVYVTGNKMFQHKGKSLTLYDMSTRYINALSRSGIDTDNDLITWLSFHPYQILRIPGIGVGGLTEILSVVYELKELI